MLRLPTKAHCIAPARTRAYPPRHADDSDCMQLGGRAGSHCIRASPPTNAAAPAAGPAHSLATCCPPALECSCSGSSPSPSTTASARACVVSFDAAARTGRYAVALPVDDGKELSLRPSAWRVPGARRRDARRRRRAACAHGRCEAVRYCSARECQRMDFRFKAHKRLGVCAAAGAAMRVARHAPPRPRPTIGDRPRPHPRFVRGWGIDRDHPHPGHPRFARIAGIIPIPSPICQGSPFPVPTQWHRP
jgi:hypothetical protein